MFLFYKIHIKQQEKIRAYSIYKNKLNDNGKVEILNFYYPKTLRAGDSIDLYYTPEAISEYYNLSGPVFAYPITFNYGVILSGDKYPSKSNNPYINSIFIGTDRLYSNSTILIELKNNIEPLKIDENYFVVINSIDGKQQVLTSTQIHSLYGMNILGYTSNIKPNNIKSIKYGIKSDSIKIEQEINIK